MPDGVAHYDFWVQESQELSRQRNVLREVTERVRSNYIQETA